MKILLININPVVSRLLTLCTRDENIELIEVESAGVVEKVLYDIVFIDENSYVADVKELLKELKARKKVFISYRNEPMLGFDEIIKKPFLPSQIIKVIENMDIFNTDTMESSISIFPLSTEEEKVEEEVLPDIFPLSIEDGEVMDDTLNIEEDNATEILNSDEIEKIKALLGMDDEIEVNEDDTLLSDDAYEARKVKVIKEQLISDGLEIVEENEIIEGLSIVAGDSFEALDKTTKNKKKKEILLNEDELSRILEAVTVAVGNMKPKKMKRLLKGKEIKMKIKLEDNQ